MMIACIRNARLALPNGITPPSTLTLQGGVIQSIQGDPPTLEGIPALDGRGLLLAPGFIDLQINGGFGHDFSTHPEALWDVAAQLPQFGVTAFLPTIISSPPAITRRARQAWAQGPPPGFKGAQPLGWHVEGPFLNPAKKGAHNSDFLRRPSLAAIQDWTPANGVRMVTLAPELPGALEVIHSLRERGIIVGAGHSLATFAQARAAFKTGITYGTHLFNAMPPLDHRQPGLAAALLQESAISVSLIADGVHLHPEIIKLTWKLKGAASITLVSDAIAALGMPPGEYVLGSQRVIVDDRSARLPDGALAGSATPLDAAVRTLAAITGAPLHETLSTVTSNPARILGLSDRGALLPGQLADLVLLTPDLQVDTALVRGKVVYRRSG